jgi:serine/threonine protein kinase
MVTAALPFNGRDLSTLLHQIVTTNPTIPMHLSPELRHLIRRLLVKDPDHRISTREIIDHPWLAEFEHSAVTSIDEDVIKRLKVLEITALDDRVVGEMRVLGYDTSDLAEEILRNQVNSRTAAYKMLRRRVILQEIQEWQEERTKKVAEMKSSSNENSAELSSAGPPSVSPSQAQHAGAGMIRKRVVAPKVSNPTAKLTIFK